MSDFKFIRVESGDGRADIVLDRAPVNILNIEMMAELRKVLRDLAADTTLRVVVLRAEGKAFSAGVDVSEHTAHQVKDMIDGFSRLFQRLWEINAVTVAAVDGAALGGGCELAIGCDIVLASEKAKFGQPEIKVGVFAPMAAVVLPKLIGRNRAFEWMMSGDIYSAVEAEKIGMVNRVFPVDGFREKVDEYVAKFSGHSAAVVALTKIAMDKAMDKPARDAMMHVDMIYLRKLMNTEDAHEGLSAFLEKRDPIWKHR